jgi:hypothetical protein
VIGGGSRAAAFFWLLRNFMPYIYKDVEKLQEEDKVGSEQCVALVQHYAGAPNTGSWKEGKGVLGKGAIVKGTAIATFVGGRYESKSHGNHAALFISADASGIWVMDQWKGDTKPKISKRHIKKKGTAKDGSFVDPSNNAEAFSVIE